ncbi:MAG: hypothetical protein LBO75_04450 [Bifidobacteriaceae bacterium]|jgi:urease accessory protein|nr:hypothetical protein [Bifidobacteriaceae bacterium]
MSSVSNLLVRADPLFTAGAGSFSSGLEQLTGDGLMDQPDALAQVMRQAVSCRWNTFDRVFLARAFAAESQEQAVLHDVALEKATLGQAARAASARTGRALLGMWSRLGDATARGYRSHPKARGHLAIVQGILCAAHGLSLDQTEHLACWAMLSQYAGAAVRLGTTGHLTAQRALLQATDWAEKLLATPVDPAQTPHAFTWLLDIAVERHGHAAQKLFAS